MLVVLNNAIVVYSYVMIMVVLYYYENALSVAVIRYVLNRRKTSSVRHTI